MSINSLVYPFALSSNWLLFFITILIKPILIGLKFIDKFGHNYVEEVISNIISWRVDVNSILNKIENVMMIYNK